MAEEFPEEVKGLFFHTVSEYEVCDPCVCDYVYMCEIYVHACIYVYACICMCIHIHIHTGSVGIVALH
jgi:hypothetical protein